MESVCFAPFLLALLLSISDTTAMYPVMTADPTEVVAKEGSNVTLTCHGEKVQSHDTTVVWKFNGHEIQRNTNKEEIEKFLDDKKIGTFSLYIKNVSRKDVGMYVCRAKAIGLSGEDYVTLSLYKKVLHVTTTQQRIMYVRGGSSITLRCKVYLTEADAVWTFWLFEGRLMRKKALGSKTLSNTVKEHSLRWRMKHVGLAQSGTYTCGANSTTIIVAQNISVRVHKLPAPKLEQSFSTVEITNGKNRTISCIAGYPEASYVDTFWLFNGSQKPTNEEHDTWFKRSEGGFIKKKISLTIYNAGLNDSGLYSCVLNTSHGLTLKNFSVRVAANESTSEVETFTTSTPRSDHQTSTATRLQTTHNVSKPSRSSNAMIDMDLKTILLIALGLLVGLSPMTLLIFYRRRCKPPASLRPPPDLDENGFKYDVFVTHSRKDFPWVDRELLRLLRENQVKYCVDHKDFELHSMNS